MPDNLVNPHHTIPIAQLQSHEGALLLVNKPIQWTSFDVVKKLKTCCQIKKIGHAGTLDPLATGLLLLCTGKKTKTISHYQNLEKVYQGKMIIGKTTPSFDLETDFDSQADYAHIQSTTILNLAHTFTGAIQQVPPAYSAIKINGQRAYKKARQGHTVHIMPRTVLIKSFLITALNIPEISFEVTCSKGTYIRSLANDFGKSLGVGAYLTGLKRTQIGPYHLKDASEIADFNFKNEVYSINTWQIPFI